MTAGKTTFSQKVLKGFLWLGTGTFLGQLIAWCSTIIVIRLLSPSDYGLMSMATIFLNLLIMLSELGLSASIIQAGKISEIEIRQIFGVVIISSFCSWVLCWLTAPMVAHFFNEDRLILLIRITSITFFLIALFIVPQSILIREMNFKAKAKVDISAQVGASVLALILAYKGMGVWALIYSLISMHIIKAIGFNMIHFYLVKPAFNLKGAEKLIKFGLTVTGDRLFYYLFTASDKIIAGKFLGEKLLGIYSVALNLASIPAEKVLPIITGVSFTSYARIQNDIERINRNLLRATRVIVVISFPLFWGMAGVAPEAIDLILGSKWISIVVPFQLICLILPFRALSLIFPPALFAIGKARINLINMIITSIVMAASFLIGVQYGLIGICIAWIVAYPVVFFITTTRCLKALELPLRHVILEVGFPLLASLLMLVFIIMIRKIDLPLHPLLLLILLILFGMFFYLSLVIAFKKDTYLELKKFLKK